MSTDLTNSIPNTLTEVKPDYVDLAQKKAVNPKFEKLKKAAQNFEAIFITQILSNMRRSINSGLFGKGMSSEIYHSMFDENIAQAIASKDGFGLSDIIIRSLHVLADEPTANLDSDTALRLIDLMSSLNRDDGITFLFSTHDPLVMEAARRVIRLRDGAIAGDEVKAGA